ncbi:MAG TPA: EamA family transporter [Candidatus Acidoferrales bacterium]|nr:EamA family transporter [Candidatus Acidoferrales bacterium]
MIGLWFYYTLIAMSLIGSLTLVDKMLVNNFIRDPIAFTMLVALSALMPFVGLVYLPLKPIAISTALLCIAAGFIHTSYVYPYYRSLVFEEVSRVVPLWQLTPIFVLIFARVFLGEILSAPDYVAFILIVIGALLFSIKREQKFSLSSALYLMLISSILVAIFTVLAKYAFTIEDVFSAFLYIQIGIILSFVSLFAKKDFRQRFLHTFISIPRFICSVAVLDVAVGYLSFASYSLAISMGSVSLVSVVYALQPVYVLIAATIVGIKYKSLIQERVTRWTFTQKLLAVVLIFIGIYIVNFPELF